LHLIYILLGGVFKKLSAVLFPGIPDGHFLCSVTPRPTTVKADVLFVNGCNDPISIYSSLLLPPECADIAPGDRCSLHDVTGIQP